jgi:DNA-binding NtrC family response regulator
VDSLVTRVLLVDDDIELLDIARILLQKKAPDVEIFVSSSVKDAFEKLENEEIDVIISDYLIPDSSGLDMIKALRTSGDGIGFVIWKGHSSEEVVIKSLNLGTDYYVLKGEDYRDQFSAIKDVIQDVTKKKSIAKSPMIEQDIASKFIHRLSHDIIGIANNILGYATLLEEEINPEYIEGINRLTVKLGDRIKTAVSEVDAGALTKK